MESIYHLPPDVWQSWLLTEEIACTGYTVAQRYAVYGDTAVFVNEGVLAYIDGMEMDLILDIGIVGMKQEVYQFANLLWTVDMEFSSPPQEVHRPYQTGQSEDVVAMIMADEDMANVGHR